MNDSTRAALIGVFMLGAGCGHAGGPAAAPPPSRTNTNATEAYLGRLLAGDPRAIAAGFCGSAVHRRSVRGRRARPRGAEPIRQRTPRLAGGARRAAGARPDHPGRRPHRRRGDAAPAARGARRRSPDRGRRRRRAGGAGARAARLSQLLAARRPPPRARAAAAVAIRARTSPARSPTISTRSPPATSTPSSRPSSPTAISASRPASPGSTAVPPGCASS